MLLSFIIEQSSPISHRSQGFRGPNTRSHFSNIYIPTKYFCQKENCQKIAIEGGNRDFIWLKTDVKRKFGWEENVKGTYSYDRQNDQKHHFEPMFGIFYLLYTTTIYL